jgi:hypothetical protein
MMFLHHKMRLCFLIVSFFTVFPVYAHEIEFNNGSAQDYAKASSLKGDVRKIQEQTKGLWPRSSQGTIYSAGNNKLSITENNKYLIFKTNNLPDHELSTTNPNCAVEQSYKFLIPKTPKRLSSPTTITKKLVLLLMVLLLQVHMIPRIKLLLITALSTTVHLTLTRKACIIITLLHFA